jgi:hypothetical protein
MRGRKMFLVPIFKDLRIQKITRRPIEMIFFDEDGSIDVKLIEKTAIVCDVCNSQVAVREDELDSLPAGFALTDGEYLYEVICEDCRRRYYSSLKVYSELEEANEGEK